MCLNVFSSCLHVFTSYVMRAIDMFLNKRPLTLQHWLPSSAELYVRLSSYEVPYIWSTFINDPVAVWIWIIPQQGHASQPIRRICCSDLRAALTVHRTQQRVPYPAPRFCNITQSVSSMTPPQTPQAPLFSKCGMADQVISWLAGSAIA